MSHRDRSVGFAAALFALTLSLTVSVAPAVAQTATLDPNERAATILNGARTAFNQRQFDVAAQRFDEFLREFGGHPEATSARFGWGVSLLEGPVKGNPAETWQKAIDQLNGPAGDKAFADRPTALYYQGLAWRRRGHDALRLGVEKPNEAPQRLAEANGFFTQALPKFAEAAVAFDAKAAAAPAQPVPAPPANPATATELPVDRQWAARSRCDQAEMLLRLGKPKEALDLCASFVAEGTPDSKSRYAALGAYCHGQAAFVLRDHVAAGRSLSRLAPFSQPAFGNQARYLLARTHHLAGERGEATKLYRVVLDAYAADKLAAQQRLATADAFKNDPDGRVQAELLVKSPPDYASRAALYLAVLLYEQEQFGEALVKLANFEQTYPAAATIPEAQLRRGMCQVQSKQFAEALTTLQPLVPHADLGDRASLWRGRAYVLGADPAQAQPFADAVGKGANEFRQAADRANQALARDPDAKLRRIEALLELGDAQQRLGQFAEAVATYETASRERHDPHRIEETHVRLATAYHLAKRYDDSDRICREFLASVPNSVLTPAILFRAAENAFVRAADADPGKPLAQSPTRKQWLDDTRKRLAPLLEKHPEFEQIALARYRLGLASASLGDWQAAVAAFAGIAEPDRRGDLVAVGYHQADAQLHLLPQETGDDALAAARVIQQIAAATKLLDAYVATVGTTKTPELPDALLKLGYCQQRSATMIAQKEARNEALQKARATYERTAKDFDQTPTAAVAIYERAKVLVEQGDPGNAANEFGRFRSDPLKASPVAPLALLRLSSLLRAQNKAEEAVKLLAECRAQHEAALKNDPARSAWAPLIQHHHGLALRETNKPTEARAVFEGIVRDFATRPEVPEAAWRASQCAKDEALVKLTPARALRAKVGATPQELAQAQTDIQQSVDSLRKTADALRAQATALAAKSSGSPLHQRVLYEAAWCARTVGEEEIEAERRKQAEAARTARQQQLAAKAQAAKLPVPNAGLPEIASKSVPIAPAEKTAREQYQALIAAANPSPLALRARLELAEMLAARDAHDEALPLLLDAIDLEPPLELEQRLRLVLGDCLLAKGQAAAGREQLLAVVADDKSPVAPLARYRAGECAIALKEWPKAIELLLPFRDSGPLQNLPGLTDRALLRLGHAYAAANDWDRSRSALEQLLGRFPQSPWRFEARYGMGFAQQNMQQWDPACQQYQQVIRETATEPAAKAQLQLGRCRFQQKRFDEAAKELSAVATTYDYPEWNAAALYESSRAYDELKQPEPSARALKRLLEDYPQSPWADPAKERSAQLSAAAAGGAN